MAKTGKDIKEVKKKTESPDNELTELCEEDLQTVSGGKNPKVSIKENYSGKKTYK